MQIDLPTLLAIAGGIVTALLAAMGILWKVIMGSIDNLRTALNKAELRIVELEKARLADALGYADKLVSLVRENASAVGRFASSIRRMSNALRTLRCYAAAEKALEGDTELLPHEQAAVDHA